MRFAETEARAGALDLAERHLAAALVCVKKSENLWLERSGSSADERAGAARRRDFSWFERHSDAALRVARQSGNRVIEFAAQSNLGMASLWAGNLDDANSRFRQAEPLCDGRPYDAVCSLDNFAHLELLRENPSQCRERLEQINRITGSTLSEQPWARLASNITWIKYLMSQGQWEAARRIAEESLEVAVQRRDSLLKAQFMVASASLNIDTPDV